MNNQNELPTPREFLSEGISPLNKSARIFADERDANGGSHVYAISVDNGKKMFTLPSFQNGPIKESGFNGITEEALITIVLDRLRGFNEGPFRCRENSIVITHLEDALNWLNKRTLDRERRGVEGTHTV